jgi:hypothetical protein
MAYTSIANKYKQQRDELQRRFEAERTGDQTLFIDQTKLLKPLIEIQKETSKSIQDKIVAGQDATSNALIPFTRELQRRNDQVETLQNLPFYNLPPEIEDAPQSTPIKAPVVTVIDFDKGLDKTQREDLQKMSFELPSVVFKKETVEETLKRIETKNRQLGQYLREDSKKNEEEKLVCKSQQNTLKIYRESLLLASKGVKRFKKSGEGLHKHKSVKLKRGRGRPKMYPDTIIYANPNELCEKLAESITAKRAGNTGLDNRITSMLDELLEHRLISKENYDVLFKNYISL